MDINNYSHHPNGGVPGRRNSHGNSNLSRNTNTTTSTTNNNHHQHPSMMNSTNQYQQQHHYPHYYSANNGGYMGSNQNQNQNNTNHHRHRHPYRSNHHHRGTNNDNHQFATTVYRPQVQQQQPPPPPPLSSLPLPCNHRQQQQPQPYSVQSLYRADTPAPPPPPTTTTTTGEECNTRTEDDDAGTGVVVDARRKQADDDSNSTADPKDDANADANANTNHQHTTTVETLLQKQLRDYKTQLQQQQDTIQQLNRTIQQQTGTIQQLLEQRPRQAQQQPQQQPQAKACHTASNDDNDNDNEIAVMKGNSNNTGNNSSDNTKAAEVERHQPRQKEEERYQQEEKREKKKECEIIIIDDDDDDNAVTVADNQATDTATAGSTEDTIMSAPKSPSTSNTTTTITHAVVVADPSSSRATVTTTVAVAAATTTTTTTTPPPKNPSKKIVNSGLGADGKSCRGSSTNNAIDKYCEKRIKKEDQQQQQKRQQQEIEDRSATAAEDNHQASITENEKNQAALPRRRPSQIINNDPDDIIIIIDDDDNDDNDSSCDTTKNEQNLISIKKEQKKNIVKLEIKEEKDNNHSSSQPLFDNKPAAKKGKKRVLLQQTRDMGTAAKRRQIATTPTDDDKVENEDHIPAINNVRVVESNTLSQPQSQSQGFQSQGMDLTQCSQRSNTATAKHATRAVNAVTTQLLPLPSDKDSKNIRDCINKAVRDPTNSKTQDIFCEKIRDHLTTPCNAKNTINAEKICSLGGIETLCNALMNHPKNKMVQMEGSNTISKLIYLYRDASPEIARLGAIDCIITAMKNWPTDNSPSKNKKKVGFYNMAEHGCAALKELSYNNDNTRFICDSGGLQAVVYAIETNPQILEVQKAGSQFLQNMTKFLPTTIIEISESRVVPTLLEFFSMDDKNSPRWHTDSDFQLSVCGLITNVATSKKTRENISSGSNNNIIGVVMGILDVTNDPDVKQSAILALEYLSEDHIKNQNNIWLADGVELFFQSIKSYHDNSALVTSSFNMIEQRIKDLDDETIVRKIADVGGIPVIIKSIKTHPTKVKLQVTIFVIIGLLILEGDDTKYAAELTSAVLECMFKHTNNKNLQIQGCDALFELSQHASSHVILKELRTKELLYRNKSLYEDCVSDVKDLFDNLNGTYAKKNKMSTSSNKKQRYKTKY